MTKRLKVIYLPGVGDSNPIWQRGAVKLWKYWDAEAELYEIGWAEQVDWQTKRSRILARVDELRAIGQPIAIVSASAGAAAAMSIYAARKNDIVGVVCICGKLKGAQNIGPVYRQTNPALIDAVNDSENALSKLDGADRERILCRSALIDGRIADRNDSIVEGAHNRYSPSFGHAATIAFQLTLGAPSFLRFLKRQNT